MGITAACLEPADRLGRFAANEGRPVPDEFASFEAEESVFFSQQRLKSVSFSFISDYSLATRHAEKELVEF